MWDLDYKESWVRKNWCFWTVVLERTLESPLNYKEIQPVHPEEISPECSLEGLILKLKVQYFCHLMWRTNSFERPWCWERLWAGGEEDDRGWDGWMASPTQWTWDWVNFRTWLWTGRPGMLQPMGLQRVRYNWAIELNWTDDSQITLKNLWTLLAFSSSLSLFLKNICLLWLWWVFTAPQAFATFGQQRLHCSCGAWASHCSGFSCCSTWTRGQAGFRSWGFW